MLLEHPDARADLARDLRERDPLVDPERHVARAADVRSGTGTPIEQTNCHPFRHGRWLFMHNGFIGGYHRLRGDLLLGVDPSFLDGIDGTTDSELMFRLALSWGLEEEPLGTLERMAGFIEETPARGSIHGSHSFHARRAQAISRGNTTNLSRNEFVTHLASLVSGAVLAPEVSAIEAIGVPLSSALVASDVGSNKPALGHWRAFRDTTRVDHERHVHVAQSHFHGVVSAYELGTRSVGINRLGEGAQPTPTPELPDLRGRADLLDEFVAC